MTTKKVLISSSTAVLALACLVLAVRFLFGGPEDTWLCRDGQWVRHGSPSAPIPVTPCLIKSGPQAGTGADSRLAGWQKPAVSDFVRTGKLVQNSPDLKPNVWYLEYEQPASPLLHQELIFLEGVSTCEFGGGETACVAPAVSSGAPAKIQGYRLADAVVVWKLESPPGAGQKFAYFSSLASGLPFKEIQRIIGPPNQDSGGPGDRHATWKLSDSSEIQAVFDGQDLLVSLDQVQSDGTKRSLLK